MVKKVKANGIEIFRCDTQLHDPEFKEEAIKWMEGLINPNEDDLENQMPPTPASSDISKQKRKLQPRPTNTMLTDDIANNLKL